MSVNLETTDGISVVALDWPVKRNALGPEEANELADALESLQSQQVVVLRGNGPAFCAGGDLLAISTIAEMGSAVVREMVYSGFQRIARSLRRLSAVTIAAIDGPAVGAGVDLAMLCDLRYVGSGGWFLQGWLSLGLVPGMGGNWMIRSVAGSGVAWEFATSSERWDGPKLDRHGLAINVEGSAFEAAMSRAVQLTKTDQNAISGYLALLRDREEEFEGHLEQCATLQADLLASDRFLTLARKQLQR